MGRILHTILNPVGVLVWWLARKIDGWFSPAVGMVAAVIITLWAVSMSGTFIYAVKDEIGRTVGLMEPVRFKTISGVVQAITDETRKKLTVKQDLIVYYELDGQPNTFKGHVTEDIVSAYKVGETITVYLPEGGQATLRDPADRAGEIMVSIIALIFALVLLYLAWRYFHYRRRILVAVRGERIVVAPAAPQAPILRGNTPVLSTADRMKADSERIRRLTGK